MDQRNSMIGQNALTSLPRVVQPGEAFAQSRSLGPSWRRRPLTFQAPSDSRIAFASNYERAIRQDTPVGGWSWEGRAPVLRLSGYQTPAEEPTAFHEFFGVRPAPETATLPPESSEPIYVQTERHTESRVRDLEQRALARFKAATFGEREGKAEELTRAMDLLISVRDLDPEAYMPCLLVFHASLERNRIAQALHALTAAIKRHPTVFVEQPDIASYFGDPRVFQRQMRRYVRLEEEHVKSHEEYSVQAYCAWALADRARLRATLDKLEELVNSGDLSPLEQHNVRTLQYALGATLR
ncbi:MAG: hypothetical protein KKB50_20480 [Planctomycetes bacterium]|nr:hypothetical protein [Planctomycetota bacterium]